MSIWDGLIGGLGGGVVVGGAQMWSYWLGGRRDREDAERRAAVDLLEDLDDVDRILIQLPHPTSAPAGSPLSYGERVDVARPALDRLRRADARSVPLLMDSDMRARFRVLRELCSRVAKVDIDAAAYPAAIDEVRSYLKHVEESLQAILNDQRLPKKIATPQLTTRPVG